MVILGLRSRGRAKLEAENEQLRQLKVVRRNAEYLRLLVNDLIDVSQLETGHITIEAENISLNDILDDLRTSFSPILERKQQV